MTHKAEHTSRIIKKCKKKKDRKLFYGVHIILERIAVHVD